MKTTNKIAFLLLMFLIPSASLFAQKSPGYSLQQLLDSALKNNKQLKIKNYQIQERKSQVKELDVKRYPSAVVDANVQRNFTIPSLDIPAGIIGEVRDGNNNPQLLPAQSASFTIGDKTIYGASVGLYQPLTQQYKLGNRIAMTKTDIALAEQDRTKTSLQIQQTVQKLYYGLLIARKQKEELKLKIELESAKLFQTKGAVKAGKANNADVSGLEAEVVDAQQNLLKLDIQEQDYISDLSVYTFIPVENLDVVEAETQIDAVKSVEEYKTAANNNPDLKMADMNIKKAAIGISEARNSNLPDVGVIVGYNYQKGNPLLATSVPYAGVSLKWNLQDLFSNKQLANQRKLQLKQAEESKVATQQQLHSDVEKSWRKVQQYAKLMEAADKAVKYRKAELKVRDDNFAAGFEIKTNVIKSKRELAKSEADLYAAILSYKMAITELSILAGQDLAQNSK